MRPTKKLASSISLILVLVVFLTTYQNCSPVNFSPAGPDSVNPYCLRSDPNCTNPPPCDAAVDPRCAPPIQKVLSLAMLSQNPQCVMCHMKVTGDLSGFGTMPFRWDVNGQILGNFYVADQKLQYWANSASGWILDSNVHDALSNPELIGQTLPELSSYNLIGAPGNYSVIPGEVHNIFSAGVTFLQGGGLYSLTSNDPNNRVVASNNVLRDWYGDAIVHPNQFPYLSVARCNGVNGSIILANGTVLSSPINGNLVIANGARVSVPLPSGSTTDFNNYDKTCPANKRFTINGEVVVNGDVILAGCFQGRGTIYSSGSIYIPDDIKSNNTAFPYPATIDQNTLRLAAESRVSNDMLSLGSQKFIIIGDIRMEVIGHEENSPTWRVYQGAIENIFNWLSTSTASARTIYANDFLKKSYVVNDPSTTPPTAVNHVAAVSLVEANMYANIGIAATLTTANSTNIVINGSVISPNLSLLSSGFAHYTNPTAVINPFNGRSFDMSEINQDFRLKFTSFGYECHRSSGP